MRVENHDFFEFNPEISGEQKDIYLSKDFLEHYALFIRKNYHIPEKSIKVCPEAEAKELDNLVNIDVSKPKYSKRSENMKKEAENRIIPNKISITEPKIVTLFASDKTAKVRFSCKTERAAKINIYMAPAWPTRNEEVLIGTFLSNGELSVEKELSGINLWSAETPELYDIRFEALNRCGNPTDDTVVETGFRFLEKRDDGFYLNNKRYTIKGAAVSQEFKGNEKIFIPCSWQIVWEYLMLKRMQGNTLSMNVTDEESLTLMCRLADRLGVMLHLDADDKISNFHHNHPSIICFKENEGEMAKREFCSLFVLRDFKVEALEDPATKEAGGDGVGYRESQAEQALKVSHIIKRCRVENNDGMLWDALFGGATDLSTLASIIDRFGYAKLAYHIMKENYKTVTCVNDDTSAIRTKGFRVKPVLLAPKGETYTVTVAVIDENGIPLKIKTYGEVECADNITRLPEWIPNIDKAGYYAIKTIVL